MKTNLFALFFLLYSIALVVLSYQVGLQQSHYPKTVHFEPVDDWLWDNEDCCELNIEYSVEVLSENALLVLDEYDQKVYFIGIEQFPELINHTNQ
jgi:hypothetical protein